MTEEQKQLADIMIGYWSRFARTGPPGTAGAPRWSITAVQQLAPDRIGPTHPASGHHCALWWTMP
jgi:para-nitrobenzyl esterase